MARKIKQDYNYKQINKGKLTEHNSIFNNDTVNWEAEEGLVHSDPLVESGGGKPIILRRFDFSLPPGFPTPSVAEILKHHKSKVIAFLWTDELELIKDLKVVFSKDKKAFRIFATCEAKKGSRILQTPQLLQEMTQGNLQPKIK